MEMRDIVRSWSAKNVVDYYLVHRRTADDLYPSERHFIVDALKDGKSILDIGCAVGGFSKIVKHYNEAIEYTGVDISSAMVRQAKNNFPKDRFYLCDGERLNFPNESFDICISFGVLHMTEKWRALLREAWRVCRNTLLFDLRIVGKKGISNTDLSYQRIEFGGKWNGHSKAPYIVLSLKEAIECMADMRPRIRLLKAYGYRHAISPANVSTFKAVYMSVFCLQKNGYKTGIDWQLPLTLSKGLRKKILF